MKFLNVCFPYEVEIGYMCPTKVKSQSGNVLCYTGKVTAKLDNLSQTSLRLPIPLTGKNGYEKNPVEEDKVVADFFTEQCAKDIIGVLRSNSTSAWLLSKECNLTIKGLDGFTSSASGQDIKDKTSENYTSNLFIVADQGYKTVITSVKIDAKKPDEVDSENLDGSKIGEVLAKPVTESIQIKYCDLEQNYDVRAAGCAKTGTITWTKEKKN